MTEDSKPKLKEEKKRKREKVEEEEEQEESGIAASDVLSSGVSCTCILLGCVADSTALRSWGGGCRQAL